MWILEPLYLQLLRYNDLKTETRACVFGYFNEEDILVYDHAEVIYHVNMVWGMSFIIST